MTRKEFILSHKMFEMGMIHAYTHLLNFCKVCIKAHKEDMSKKRLNQLAEMNKHLWKK
jgi:hypothetical protein